MFLLSDHRQYNIYEAASDTATITLTGSPKFLELLANNDDFIKTISTDDCHRSTILKEDPWLFDGSTPKLPLPKLPTISPNTCFSAIQDVEWMKCTSKSSAKAKRKSSQKKVLGVKNEPERSPRKVME